MLDYKPDLLDNLQLPAAPDWEDMGIEETQIRDTWTINRADFADFLCFHTESMSLVVPDPVYLKTAIGAWSKAHVHEWQRLFDTLFYKYNPLWNKDFQIVEEEDTERDRQDQQYNSGSITTNSKATGYTNGYDGGTSTEQDPMMTSAHPINWTHADKAINTSTGSSSGNTTTTTDDDASRTRTQTEKGNIGVTQVQQMIESERQVALFSIEEFIADAFKEHFCIMIW